MTDLNIKKIQEMKKNILHWNSRSHTAIGKLTAIKTLLIPKKITEYKHFRTLVRK